MRTKNRGISALLVAGVLFFTFSKAFAESPQMPKSRQTDASYVNALTDHIFKNWEHSSCTSVASVKYQLMKDGSFKDVRIRLSSGDPQMDFSCIEAVKQSSGFMKNSVFADDTTMEIVFKPAQIASKFNCIREKKHASEFVVLHFIPLESLQSNLGLKPELVHNEENLVLIRKELCQSTEMNNLREEWLTYLRRGEKISAREIKQKAIELKQKHISLLSDK